MAGGGAARGPRRFFPRSFSTKHQNNERDSWLARDCGVLPFPVPVEEGTVGAGPPPVIPPATTSPLATLRLRDDH